MVTGLLQQLDTMRGVLHAAELHLKCTRSIEVKVDEVGRLKMSLDREISKPEEGRQRQGNKCGLQAA